MNQYVGAARAVVVGLLLVAGNAWAGTIVREGTEVELRFLSDVSSATATIGEKFELEVVQDVKSGDAVLIPARSKAVGTVQNAKKKGMLGKSGELNVAINYVVVNGTRIPLRASQGAEGEGRVGSTVALTVLFGPVGLLKRGLDVTIPSGKTLTAAVDSTTEIAD